MDVRPGYKQTDVGIIPEDWEVKTIDQVASVTSGKRLPLGSSLVDQPTPYPYIRVTDMRPGTVDTSEIKYVPESVFPAIKRYRIYQSDIFISVAGSLGIVGKVPEELDGANLTENADRITNIECSQDYLLYILMTPLIQNTIDAIRTVGAQPKLALTRIRQFEIPLPPRETEQSAIATAIRDVDSLLDGLNRLVAKKRDLHTGAMQRLLTGATRLPGFTDPWQEKRLGDHVSFLRNGVHSRAQLTVNDPVCYLHYGDIHVSSSIRLDLSKAMMPRLPAAAAARLTRLEDGDVVFVDASEDLVGVGKSVEIEGAKGVEAVAGQHTIAARFDKQVLADGFKGYLQFVPTFIAHLRRLAAGTKVYATNRKHIASAEIALPEPDEQRAIARVLSDMEAEIAALEARLAKTRDLKQAMMQALLTGRVRLPVSTVETCEPEAAHA